MQNTLSHFFLLARRWWWLVVVGIVLSAGPVYVISKLTHPVYRATATLIVSFQTSTSSNDSVAASLAAVPTYAQVVTSPVVLNSVLALHPGMTTKQLVAMVIVTPKPNSQLIELDVENTDPKLAMNLANEISDRFVQYINPQLTASVFPVYAELPVDPVRPKPSQDAGIGALVGLGLALALIFVFEWIDDRLGGPEELQELLGMEMLAVIPRLSRGQHMKRAEDAPVLAEACRMLCAGLNSAQAVRPFKMVMITSALAGEGKSTVAANLASFLALAGKRVLLVDADLRRPVQNRHFQLDNSRGLSDVLAQASNLPGTEPQSQATGIPTLRVLTAGVPSPHSAELLQSPLADQLFDYFKRAPFDYVLFDTPPLLPVADAQFLASRIHAAVLVVDASKTPRKVLLRAKSVFNRAHIMILGVAINKSRWPEYGYIREYQKDLRQSNTIHSATLPLNIPPANRGVATPIPRSFSDSMVDIPIAAMPLHDEVENMNIPMTFPVDCIANTPIQELPAILDGEVAANTPDPLDGQDVDSNITMTLPRSIRPKPKAGPEDEE